MNQIADPNDDHPKRGAVAVVYHAEKYLVIQRSDQVRAGGLFCFPGGGIEEGESSAEAVVRELHEELGLPVTPIREIWQCRTRWSVDLAFWLVDACPDAPLAPNPEEVKWVGWKSDEEMRAEPRMLSSAIDFLDAVKDGTIRL